ncbi:hypothetical protein EAE96_006223 [Botrytis aclada]|nr:hypothetical protein EAE96_006223 [Botrytis aclada]
MCNTYTIILKCNHKQTYTYRCPLYLSAPRQKCVRTPPTIAHYFVSCRKCRGQESDDFVVHWVEKENESASNTVGGKEGNWRKGEESNYMLAIGTFEILANGDETGGVKGVRVYENGTEETRREKKGRKNVSLDLSGTNKASLDAGPSQDIYDQINESTQELKLDGMRTQSLPVKGKLKKSNVFGSLRKMIVQPKSEQDTAATGEHTSPTQVTVKSKLNRFNTITGGFRGGKKSEDMEEESSLSASADDRRVDDVTGYEYLTPKEFLDLHFQGVVAGSSADVAMSRAISAPIDIPQKRQGNSSQKWTAERHAGEYMSQIGRNPFADNSAVAVESFIRDSAISDVENSYQEGASERWSHDTHSSGQGRMSRETEFSQADEEQMEIITEAIDGDTINLTPDNIDDVLAIWKGGFGTSTPSSPIHIPPRPHALSHSVHSRSIEVLPIPIPFRSPGSSLDVASYSASLPNAQVNEKRIAKAQWTQENYSERVSSPPSATLQHAVDFVEPPRCFDAPQRNNTTKEHLREFALPKRSNTGDEPHARCPPNISEESPSQGFALPKRSNTGDGPYSRQISDKTNELPHGFAFPKRIDTRNLPQSRHPLANEIIPSNTLASSQAPTKSQPTSPDIQKPATETIPGTRYSSLPSSPTILSPPGKGKQSEQGRQSPRIWNRKGTPVSKPEPRTSPLVPERIIDRISTMTTISQFIPSRNEERDEENLSNVNPLKTSIKTPRRRMGSSNVQHPAVQNPMMSIPDVPAIPKTYAKHVTVLPRIGRDATGRFSVEYIKQEESASVDKDVIGEVLREELVEDSIDIYANHTIGTWDAVLRHGTGDVSPLSLDEDLNRVESPVSPVEGSVSGKARDGEERGGCLGGEMWEDGSGLLSQHIHQFTASPAHLASTLLSSKNPPLCTLTPPLSPQSLHISPSPSSPSSLHPPQQHLHLHLHSQSPPSLQHTPHPTPSNTILPLKIDPSIDPSIPLILPLQIRKKNPAPACSKSETEKSQEIEARRRQRERVEEEFRRADERMRRLRDGRGGL